MEEEKIPDPSECAYLSCSGSRWWVGSASRKWFVAVLGAPGAGVLFGVASVLSEIAGLPIPQLVSWPWMERPSSKISVFVWAGCAW